VNGGYAEYVLALAAYVGHLPTRVEFTEVAPILCAGVTTYKGLKETETKAGEWAIISARHMASTVPLLMVICKES
jgi:propanol-preferring alcohol dehydrogenase